MSTKNNHAHGASGNPAKQPVNLTSVPVNSGRTQPPPPRPGPPPQQNAGPGPEVIQQLRQDLEQLAKSNISRVDALGKKGLGFDKAMVLSMRIDSLMESVAAAMGPIGPAWLIQAQIEFEKTMTGYIEQVEEEGMQSLLAQGSNLSPASIHQLARESGKFGKMFG